MMVAGSGDGAGELAASAVKAVPQGADPMRHGRVERAERVCTRGGDAVRVVDTLVRRRMAEVPIPFAPAAGHDAGRTVTPGAAIGVDEAVATPQAKRLRAPPYVRRIFAALTNAAATVRIGGTFIVAAAHRDERRGRQPL